MRIMHLELGRHLYGGAKQVVYLINAIHAQHNEVEQVLVCAAGSDISKLALPGCNTHSLPYAGELDMSMLWRLAATISATKPDILHVHSRRGADVWGAIIAKCLGIPAICTRRVDNPESRLAALKYKPYRAVISISHGVKSVVSKHCAAGAIQQVIHSSVDLAEFQYLPDPDWFHQAFNIPSNHKVIANFAQLIGRKGQSDIISAMGHVIKRYPNTTCLLFGKGSLHNDYQQQITNAGLERHVRLCGFTADVARILPNIDLMVHPAYAEGLGVILLQAGACRCPVIASPSGGIPEIVLDKQTGWLTPAGDSRLLANTIMHALNDSKLATLLGHSLYEHVSTHFSTNAMARDYLKLYRDLIDD